MPTPTKGPRMGGSPAHERLMLANLATSLFEHGRITTTESKAKRLRPYAEHLITFGKRGDLHARRQVLKRLRDKSVVHTLFAEIGPRYADRPGGYTRIVKLGPRKGDNAPMALIELVEGRTTAQSALGEAERARGTRFVPRSAPTGATAEAAEELRGESPTAAAVDDEARSAATSPQSVTQSEVDPAPEARAGSEVVTDAEASVDEAAGSGAAPVEAPAQQESATQQATATSPEPAAPAAVSPEALDEVREDVSEAREDLSEAQEELSEAEQELAAARAQLAAAEADADRDERT